MLLNIHLVNNANIPISIPNESNPDTENLKKLEKITLKGYNVKQNVNKLYELYEI